MAISGRRRFGLVVLVAALAVAAVGRRDVRADPAPDLPSIAGDELLTSTLAALARPFTISGDVDTRSTWGSRRSHPAWAAATAAGRWALSARRRRPGYKVWRSPDGVRVAHLLASRTGFGGDPSDAWFWDSRICRRCTSGVPGTTLWEATPRGRRPRRRSLARSPTGARGDRAVRGRLGRNTATVAGRPAYHLVLTPTSTLTLVGRIAVAIDAETRLPLRFQVFPRGSDGAAIEAGFTSVSFEPIDPSMFSFTPPPGTTVRQAGGRHRGRCAGRGDDGARRRCRNRTCSVGVRPARRGPAGRAAPGRGGPAPSVRGPAALGDHRRA